MSPSNLLFKADLHCHSTCSDGTLFPEELIDHAIAIKLNALSITDHDSIAAYSTALPYAQKLSFPLISGVEFSAVHQHKSVHVLGYSFDLQNKQLAQFCAQHQKRREERNSAIIERLNAHGFDITMKDVHHHAKMIEGTIGRPHIAQALLAKGYIVNIQDAFKLYIGEGKSCYVRGLEFSVEETIDIIHNAGGYAIIAHPHLIKEPKLIQQILQLNFDGIECYYGHLPANQNERWIKAARRKQWLMTGGSDFHGDIRQGIPLGSSWIGEEHFQILNRRFLENNGNSFNQ